MPGDYFEKMSDELAVDSREEELELFLDRVSLLLSCLSQEVGVTLLPSWEGVAPDRPRPLKLSLQGLTHILEKPEFQDVGKVRTLLGVFEEKRSLSQCLLRHTSQDHVSVSVGREHEHEALEECAIVTARFAAGKQKCGTIAILGPKRMPYRRIVPMVAQMAARVGNILNSVEGEEL